MQNYYPPSSFDHCSHHRRRRRHSSIIFAVSWLLITFNNVTMISSSNTLAIIQLTTQQFKDMIGNKTFDVIMDVRSSDEWNSGHIANVTWMENLAMYGDNTSTTSTDIADPAGIIGCQYCSIAAYCNTGVRAQKSLVALQQYGFQGQLYNGLGISQWMDQKYPIDNATPSIIPSCSINQTLSDQCKTKWATADANIATASSATRSSYMIHDKENIISRMWLWTISILCAIYAFHS